MARILVPLLISRVTQMVLLQRVKNKSMQDVCNSAFHKGSAIQLLATIVITKTPFSSKSVIFGSCPVGLLINGYFKCLFLSLSLTHTHIHTHTEDTQSYSSSNDLVRKWFTQTYVHTGNNSYILTFSSSDSPSIPNCFRRGRAVALRTSTCRIDSELKKKKFHYILSKWERAHEAG